MTEIQQQHIFQAIKLLKKLEQLKRESNDLDNYGMSQLGTYIETQRKVVEIEKRRAKQNI